MTIAAATHIGAVRLRVSDIEALTSFYERAVGLRTLAREDGLTRLGADEDAPLVELVAARRAGPSAGEHRALPPGHPRP